MEQMGLAVIERIAVGGIFAVLFFFMLWYVLKTNDSRETRYLDTIDKNQDVIDKLADKLDVVEDVQEDVEEVKKDIQYIKAKMG